GAFAAAFVYPSRLCRRSPPCSRRDGKRLVARKRRRAAPRGAGLVRRAFLPRAGGRLRRGRAPARRRRRDLCPAAPAGRSAMTPFGQRMRELRAKKGVNQKQMAQALGVSAAYLSALEHGRRAAPNWALVQKIVGYFNIIWDE